MEKHSGVILKGIICLAVILSITVIASTYLVTKTVQHIKTSKGSITVKGYAERKITSDYAAWQGILSSRSDSLTGAYEKLESGRNAILEYLKGHNIQPDVIHMSSVSTYPFYKRNQNGNDTNEIEGYNLTQEFSINTKEIATVSKISHDITNLIKDGIQINSCCPRYFYSRIDELKIAMLGEAAKDAKSRAEQLVSNSGSNVGKLRAAQQGVFQLTPAFSSNFSDYGEYDTTSIDKVIKAVVTIEYAIE